MEYHVAFSELKRQGFSEVSCGITSITKMMMVRENHNICIDLFCSVSDSGEKIIEDAFKYIQDQKTGIHFARHSVYDKKNKTIHAELSPEQLTALAYFITAEAFCSVLDKGGRPYFEHCLEVSRKLGPTVAESYKQVAIMHDLLEDIKHYNTTVLEDLGFSNFVYMGVFYLSKLPSRKEIYTNGKLDLHKYMTILMSHRVCLMAKMSDLQHNSNLSRLKGITDKDFERAKNYAFWYTKLKNHGIANGWI